MLADGSIVSTGVSADVGEEYIRPFDGETVYLWVGATDIAAVDVSIDGTKRAEGSQFLCNFPRADVSAMPDFIAIFEVFQVTVVPKTVCIR